MEYVGKYYTLPANTEVFSISLQSRIKFCDDVIVKITNTMIGNDDYVFGNIQLKFDNLQLSFVAGKDMSSLVDKANGELTLNLKDLIDKSIFKTQIKIK